MKAISWEVWKLGDRVVYTTLIEHNRSMSMASRPLSVAVETRIWFYILFFFHIRDIKSVSLVLQPTTDTNRRTTLIEV